MYDFLLVINSNLALIIINSNLAFSFGVTPFEFMEKLYGSLN